METLTDGAIHGLREVLSGIAMANRHALGAQSPA